MQLLSSEFLVTQSLDEDVEEDELLFDDVEDELFGEIEEHLLYLLLFPKEQRYVLLLNIPEE